MSDGSGESGRERSNKRVKNAVNEFGRAVAKVAVAQICECEGYQGFQQSALETFSNVAVRYIQNLGKSAKFQAELAGRNECNVFDIIQGLEDFGAVQGFPGASDIDGCCASSGTVKELVQYVSESEEIPFAYDVPQFPIVKDRKLAPSFEQVVGESPGCHIPSWLPAFPYPLTFIPPPEDAVHDDTVELTEKTEHYKKHKETNPMLSLHQRMSHNAMEGPEAEALNSSMPGKSVETNPFLASPLKFGEVQVSPVLFPKKQLHDTMHDKNTTKNHDHLENNFSDLENPALIVNQVENHVHASKDDKFTAQEKLRASVKFCIRVGKKYRITNEDGSDEEICVGDINTWFEKAGSGDKRDDKIWNTDHNLKGGIENPEEVAQ